LVSDRDNIGTKASIPSSMMRQQQEMGQKQHQQQEFDQYDARMQQR
jgi:hypothetical protein